MCQWRRSTYRMDHPPEEICLMSHISFTFDSNVPIPTGGE
jgi:hypothetical protein